MAFCFSVCSKWSFDDGLPSTDLVKVKLSAFGDQPDIHDRSALNVTLKQIKFTSMYPFFLVLFMNA